MDWSNTQRAEIQYFCTSTRSRTPRVLCGCTLKLQLGFILTIFASYQITEFQLTDIKAFYKLLHTPHFGPELNCQYGAYILFYGPRSAHITFSTVVRRLPQR